MEAHNIFTDDLIEDILLRLRVRHLLRFRCVSKSWCALIDSSRFIEKHHQIQSAISREEGDAPIFLKSLSLDSDVETSQFHLLSKKQGDGILCLTPDLDRDRVPIDDPNHLRDLRCMGVVNGIVGVCWGDDCLGLWNPSTRDFVVVPPPRPNDFEDQMHFDDIIGLGFDPRSSDFKIVRSMFWSDEDFLCEMYSLSTNCWTSLEQAASPETSLDVKFPRLDGYYNGVHYWAAMELDDWDDDPPRYVILSFDFTTEAFKSFDPPPFVITAVNNADNFDWIVGQYMERLALIFYRQNSGEALRSFEIWVASEFDVGRDSGISLSWQHLFTIKPHSGVDCWEFVAFRMDGDVLLNIDYQGERRECNLYNPSSRTFKNLGLSFYSGYNYMESLFPLSKRQIQGYKEMDNHELDELDAIKPQLDKLKQQIEELGSMKQQLGELGSIKQQLDLLGSMRQQLDVLDSMTQELDVLGSIKQQLYELRTGVEYLAGVLTDNLNPPSQPPPRSHDGT